MYVRDPLSLRKAEDVLCERGIDIYRETVRLWWNRFGPMFAADIRRKRVDHKPLLRLAHPNYPNLSSPSKSVVDCLRMHRPAL